MISPTTTILLDKNVVRRVYHYRVRALQSLTPIPEHLFCALAFDLLLLNRNCLYITTETENVLQRRQGPIASALRQEVHTLYKAKYLRHWARRLSGRFKFTREDARMLSYGSFGVDRTERTVGADLLLTADQPLIRNFQENQDAIVKQFQSMTAKLPSPYTGR